MRRCLLACTALLATAFCSAQEIRGTWIGKADPGNHTPAFFRRVVLQLALDKKQSITGSILIGDTEQIKGRITTASLEGSRLTFSTDLQKMPGGKTSFTGELTSDGNAIDGQLDGNHITFTRQGKMPK